MSACFSNVNSVTSNMISDEKCDFLSTTVSRTHYTHMHTHKQTRTRINAHAHAATRRTHCIRFCHDFPETLGVRNSRRSLKITSLNRRIGFDGVGETFRAARVVVGGFLATETATRSISGHTSLQARK